MLRCDVCTKYSWQNMKSIIDSNSFIFVIFVSFVSFFFLNKIWLKYVEQTVSDRRLMFRNAKQKISQKWNSILENEIKLNFSLINGHQLLVLPFTLNLNASDVVKYITKTHNRLHCISNIKYEKHKKNEMKWKTYKHYATVTANTVWHVSFYCFSPPYSMPLFFIYFYFIFFSSSAPVNSLSLL